MLSRKVMSPNTQFGGLALLVIKSSSGQGNRPFVSVSFFSFPNQLAFSGIQYVFVLNNEKNSLCVDFRLTNFEKTSLESS